MIGLLGVGKGFGWEFERLGTIFLPPDARDGTVERGSGILRGLVSLAAVSIKETRRSPMERGGVHRIAIGKISFEVSEEINGPARATPSGNDTTHRSTTGSEKEKGGLRTILVGRVGLTRGWK